MEKTFFKKKNSCLTILSNENGIALIITLMVVAILTVVILEFSYKMRIDLTLAENFKNDVKAYYLAKSGIETAIAVLKKDDNSYDSLDEDWGQLNDMPIFLEDGMVKITLTDESSKFNINHLLDINNIPLNKNNNTDQKENDNKTIFRRLLEILEVNPDNIDLLIDSTIDWLDEDDESTGDVAEERFYKSLTPPYNIKNGKLSVISEIRMIKDYNDEILEQLGASRDIYNNINPNLFKYITIYSDGFINMNTASPEIIQSLSDNMDVEKDGILDAREENPFKSKNDVGQAIVEKEEWKMIKNKIQTTSNYYSIISEGSIILNRNTYPPRVLKKRITAIIRRSRSKTSGIKILYWKTE